jgi:adenylate cyclase
MTDSKSTSDPNGDDGDAADRSGVGRIRLAGFAAAALALIATTIWDSEKLRESVFDGYQSHMPRVVESHPARIVEIDDASLKKYGPWPWSRLHLARLAEGIHARGALAIGFDMIFLEADRHSPANIARIYPDLPDRVGRSLARQTDPDHKFSQTISRLPIVLARVGHHGKTIDQDRDPAKIPIEASFTGHPAPSKLLSFENVRTNLPKLDGVAAGHAVINGPPDGDGILRRVPLVVMLGGRPTPTLALEVLRVASNADDYRLETKDDKLVSITVGKRRIPTDSTGALRLHFSPPLAARSVSATSILDNTLQKDAFRGNVVFIGATALGLEDVIATPVVGEAFGVDVHAQLVETVLAGQWLQRPHWARRAEIILAIVLGLIAILVLPHLKPRSVILTGGAGILVMAGASFMSFTSYGLLLDPLAPAMVSGAAVLSMLCMMFLEADRRRQQLREALTEERV